MKFLIYLLVPASLLALPSAYAQNPQASLEGHSLIDSLINSINGKPDDTNKAKTMAKISSFDVGINSDEGISYGIKSLELATRLDWKRGMGIAHNSLGSNYNSKADYTNAAKHLLASIAISKEIGNLSGQANATCNLGNTYMNQGYFPKALEWYLNAMKIFEQTGNKVGIANTSNNIGVIYQRLKEYSNARDYFSRSLAMQEQLGKKQGAAAALCNIGCVYMDEGNYTRALEYSFKALAIDEEINDRDYQAIVNAQIGSIYNAQHNYYGAIVYHLRALAISKEIGARSSEASLSAFLAHDYLTIVSSGVQNVKAATALPDSLYAHQITTAAQTVQIPKDKTTLLHKAVELYSTAIALQKEINERSNLAESYQGLATADSFLGDYQGAYLAHLHATALKDSIFSKDNAMKISRLEIRKKVETDSLQNALQRKLAETQLTQQRNYTYMSIAGIFALLGFSFFTLRNNKLLAREKSKSENERQKADNLLLNILPEEIADELKNNGSSAARQFDNITVLFTDFVNFTQAGENMSPQALVDELHTCFKAFDTITAKYHIEKIKTIGDAYLAVCGLPKARPNHALNVVKAAKEITAFIEERHAQLGSHTFRIRIGIHSGSVIAGIVGVKKFAYDVWGDTVNTAARMEQYSMPGKINISEATYNMVKDEISCEYRGELDVKNKGKMNMYFVN